MPDPSLEPAYCTTRQAADRLGVAVGTVQAWVECGRLQAWKTAGGHRRVLRDSVDQLLRKLPQPDSAGPADRTAQAVDAPPAVVVVEDDPSLLRLYQARLTRWPQSPRVHCFDSAVKALLHIGHSRPDLLILDLRLPGMDGFSLLHNLLDSPEIGNTTLAVVTGLPAADIAARGGMPPEVRLFGKPIPFDALQDLWSTVLAQRADPTAGGPARA
jgi:excisionase family DNA binding protein